MPIPAGAAPSSRAPTSRPRARPICATSSASPASRAFLSTGSTRSRPRRLACPSRRASGCWWMELQYFVAAGSSPSASRPCRSRSPRLSAWSRAPATGSREAPSEVRGSTSRRRRRHARLTARPCWATRPAIQVHTATSTRRSPMWTAGVPTTRWVLWLARTRLPRGSPCATRRFSRPIPSCFRGRSRRPSPVTTPSALGARSLSQAGLEDSACAPAPVGSPTSRSCPALASRCLSTIARPKPRCRVRGREVPFASGATATWLTSASTTRPGAPSRSTRRGRTFAPTRRSPSRSRRMGSRCPAADDSL